MKKTVFDIIIIIIVLWISWMGVMAQLSVERGSTVG